MILTPDELAELELLMPSTAAKIRAAQEADLRSQTFVAEDEEEERVPFEESNFTGVILNSDGTPRTDPAIRDNDTRPEPGQCPACARGGSPRAGALHSCGLPNPFIRGRDTGPTGMG